MNVGPSPTFWETDAPGDVEERAGQLEPGETLGRYVVLYRLGTGGMGIVYAAYDPQLDRKVGLKLIRRMSANPARRKRATERLLREARSMARLTHPNVITVHDVAELDGRLFVAMEFIDGVTLTRHLAAAEHDWRKILELMTAAGHGLAAAHDAGLIHRDFKPDNVMIARDGRVLVMDFGLARALEPDDPMSVSHGRPSTSEPDLEDDVLPHPSRGKAPASRVAGTPGYMAPEQHRGKPTDSRTDQFSFSVTLYEALYRQRPFRGETPDEICDEIEAERIEEPPTGHGVPGWLRAVVLRGLKVRPEDRWESMNELLAALAKDPAVARRRWLVRGGMAALVGGTAVAATMLGSETIAGVCDGSDHAMSEVWDDEQRAAVTAAFGAVDRPYAKDALDGVTAELDRYAADWMAMHRDACEANRVRGEQSDDLFDLRMNCLGRRRAELKALTELFADADVDVVKEAVVATSKLTPVTACADVALLRTTVPVPDDPEVRQTVNHVRDELARAKAYEDGGRFERALELIRGVLDEARASGYDPVIAEALLRRGRTLASMRDIKPAEVALREALQAAAEGRHDEVTAQAWIALAMVLAQSGEIGRAREAAEAAELAVTRAGPTYDLRAQLANSQGVVAYSAGDATAARIAFEEALAQQKEAFGETHPSVARFLNNLAVAYGQQGDTAESVRFLERALELEERTLGSVHPRVGMILGNIGAMEVERGNLDEAERVLGRAIDILKRSTSGDNQQIGLFLNNVASVAIARLDFDRAQQTLEEAVALQERLYGDEGHPDLAMSLINLASVYVERGRAEEARAMAERALKMLHPEHPAVAQAMATEAMAESALGHYAVAVEQFELALQRFSDGSGFAPGFDIGFAYFELAKAKLGAGGDRSEAKALAEKARRDMRSRPSTPARKEALERIRSWLTDNFDSD